MPTPTRPHRSRHTGIASEVRRVATVVLVLLATLWTLELVDQAILNGALDRSCGIRPRSISGLGGVLLHPLAHGDLQHLLSNSAGLAVLGALVASYSMREFLRVTLWSTLVGGLGVWLAAPTDSVTIGASGVVFGYFGYLVARGIFERRAVSILLSVLIASSYGALIFGMVPGMVAAQVSWQAHLFGCLGGILAARSFRRR
ncbi:MAG: rhomboid family intramembrane serine protease [Nannocystaceae bacterium]